MPDAAKLLRVLDEEIIVCRKCPRLVAYREQVSREKRRAYRDWIYWGKPVPGFGDPEAQLMLVGLAPGAHGSNRTGRPFTGDKSGEFLYQALYDAGFANRPVAVQRDDGLQLHDTYITASARCAPPDNKPLPQELVNCRPYLERELEILKPRAILALGKIGWDVYLGDSKASRLDRFASHLFFRSRSGGGYSGCECSIVRRLSPQSAKHSDRQGHVGNVRRGSAPYPATP